MYALNKLKVLTKINIQQFQISITSNLKKSNTQKFNNIQTNLGIFLVSRINMPVDNITESTK